MCGFAGVAGFNRRLSSLDDGLVTLMRGTLLHRGPDASGKWSDESVSLGHQRLSILDISDAGSQPMLSASERFVLVFNGEIYNFRELAEQLAHTEWSPRSGSDSEVLVEALAAWGIEKTLQRADGMFAFAFYDTQTKHLVLGRDRFGEKPLYYGVQNDSLFFASELRAFDVTGGPSLVLDEKATVDYFRYGFVPAPETIYQGFFKVRPGTTVHFDLSQPSPHSEKTEFPAHRYWEVPSFNGTSDQRNSEEIDEELLVVLRQSVSQRLVSDRPLGAFLSGGIDSSLTCALAASQMSGSLQTFNMGWRDREFDESKQARAVANAIGSIHHQVEMSLTEIADVVARVGEVLDEPNADGSIIGMYLVAREARRHFVVALSGDGGDELFGGYNRHLWLSRSAVVRARTPRSVRRAMSKTLMRSSPLLQTLSRPLPLSRRPRLVSDKMRKLGRALAVDDGRAAYEAVLAINSELPGQLRFSSELVDSLNSRDRSNLLWGLRSADILWYLPDAILSKVDRSAMAVSLETRSAFLNPEVARIAMGMSYGQLLEDAQGKRPLRRLLDDLIPDCDFSSPKTGFGTPFARLMRGEAADLTVQSLQRFQARSLPADLQSIDWPRIQQEFFDGDDNRALQIWSVLVFELWASQRQHAVAWL